MNKNEFAELVQEYNEVEKAQGKRLEALYLALRARRGYRFARFSNGSNWSNAWDLGIDENLALKLHVLDRVSIITEITPGDD